MHERDIALVLEMLWKAINSMDVNLPIGMYMVSIIPSGMSNFQKLIVR